MPRRAALLVCTALSLLFGSVSATAEALQPLPYQLGQGLYFPQQGLRIGGYISIHYIDLERYPTTLNVNDLSLFLTKELTARWSFFAEMEIDDALTITADDTSSRNAHFDLERLYLDYRAHQSATLRLGRFLTPVGQWNLIHADPLVWTVSRPLATGAAFSRHATGAMVYGSIHAGRGDLDYWLFRDDNEHLNPFDAEELAFDPDGASLELHNNFRHATGARLLFHMLDEWVTIGASYLSYELEQPHHHYQLGGLDFTWSSRYVDLSGEAIYRRAEDSAITDERGGYLQAVIPLPHDLYLVGRRESYRTSTLGEVTTLDTLGINYRPQPAIAFKLEYNRGSNNDLVSPDGWLASFGVLF
jgi:hypothetical protein